VAADAPGGGRLVPGTAAGEAAGRDSAEAGPATHGRSAAVVLLALLTLVWGVHWVVAKAGLAYMPPLTYGALRVAGGLAAVVVVVGLRGRLRMPDRRDLPVVLSVGLGQVAGGVALMNLALQVVPAGRSSILVYTMPIWVVVIQAVVLRLAPSGAELAGLAVGLAGIAVLVNPFSIDWSAPGGLAGAGLLLLSAAIWGATSIHVRRHRWTTSPAELQPWQLLVALVPLALLAFALEPGTPVRWELPTVLFLLYSGPLATAFAFWASQSITRSLGPLAATVGFLGVPVVGLAAGALLLGEALTPLDLAGCALVAAGILLVTRRSVRRPTAPTAARATPAAERLR
jgi:drug/metabolite transporter (DMT)-like permease